MGEVYIHIYSYRVIFQEYRDPFEINDYYIMQLHHNKVYLLYKVVSLLILFFIYEYATYI